MFWASRASSSKPGWCVVRHRQGALRGKATEEDACHFAARMSVEDGLEMHVILDMEDAHEIALDAAYRLAKRAYRCSEE